MFNDDVKYCLVISTPLQVVLIGVSIKQSQTQLIQLYAANISVAADTHQMLHIVGTDEGRIFMISESGGLYEFEYGHPSQWTNNGSMICRTEPFMSRYIPTFTPSFMKPASYRT